VNESFPTCPAPDAEAVGPPLVHVKRADIQHLFPPMAVDFNPSKAFFIKLGEGGKWEENCIKTGNTLRFGFNAAPHEGCLKREWDVVGETLKQAGYKKIKDTIRQIECFYHSDESVLWVTFYADRLWWCFSKPRVTLLPDKSKTRFVIGKWQSTDLIGKPLYLNQLSGKLLRVQRYQGTICAVIEFDYLLQKLKGVVRADVRAAQKALTELEQSIEIIIRDLTPKDFEILIDLIFRQAGWQRAGILGGPQKTLDLELLSPITSERFGVQIKAEADLVDFETYKASFHNMQDFDCFYFAFHTPKGGLEQAKETKRVKLLRPRQIAHLVTKYGLADWVIAKAG